MKIKSKTVGPIRAAILSWFGVYGSDYLYTDGVGVNSPSGVPVDQDRMLTLSAVWACTRLISETIATLPLSMYEKTSAGKRVASQHWLQFIIHDQPNMDSTAAVFWEAVVAAMLLRGNARAEKLMVGARVVGLMFLDPRRLTINRNGQGRKQYLYLNDDGTQREIPAARIWNIPGFSLDGKCGVSVIRYGATVFGSALAADTAASTTFANGLMPRVWFKYPKVLTPQQREEARENTIGRLAGAINAGKPAILENEMEVGTVGINPDDAQLLESRAFGVEEICRWFRVPPFMVGHAEKSTSWGTGIEQQMIGFLTFTLAPWLKRIEQAISKDLLAPTERLRYYPKFAVEGLLRADSAGRSAFYSAMVNNGIMTRDEVRELEDREPMGGNAALLTVQSAMTTLDGIGINTEAQAVRASLRTLLGLNESPAERE
jgi:HK97 family phage portal protein